MPFGNKVIQDIDENDLLTLIGTSSEDTNIDFKSAAYPQYKPPNQDDWKKEFQRDIASFANANGGWIICGMSESGGIATALIGLGPTLNAEREIQRLEQSANNGIEPRIPGLVFRDIPLSDPAKSKAIVIYIPYSYAGPHWVKETMRFPKRRSKSKDDMNLAELRAAFNLSETFTTRIKEFRKSRLAAIQQGSLEDVPVELSEGSQLVLHVIPATFVDEIYSVNIASLRSNSNWIFGLRGEIYQDKRFNFNGFVFSRTRSRPYTRYCQIYRNGTLEYVMPIFEEKNRAVWLNPLEEYSLCIIEDCLTIQRNLSVQPPLVIMLSLINRTEFRLIYSDHPFAPSEYPTLPLKQTLYPLPDVVLESYDDNLNTLMKPVFDVLSNMAGLPNSKSYDQNGNWTRQLSLRDC